MNAPDESIQQAAAAWVARRDAGLSPPEQEKFEAWVNADPRHREAFAYFISTWETLAAPAQTGAGAELEQALEKLARHRRRRRSTGLAGLAALLMVGVFTWALRDPVHHPLPPTASILSPRLQTLPDGSSVELNTAADINVRFTPAERRVSLLRGEAHFIVQKDLARPFIVSADGIEVRAVGTAFNVQLGPATVAVLVTEGQVAIEQAVPERSNSLPSPSPLETTPPTLLSAGHEVVLERSMAAAPARLEPVTTAAAAEKLAWRGARVEFTRTPLPQAVALLNRYASPSSPRLSATDPALSSILITGIFRPDNTEGFVLLLEGGFGVRSLRAGNTIILQSAR